MDRPERALPVRRIRFRYPAGSLRNPQQGAHVFSFVSGDFA